MDRSSPSGPSSLILAVKDRNRGKLRVSLSPITERFNSLKCFKRGYVLSSMPYHITVYK